MFKRIGRRVSAVLMASAVVLSNIIMPIEQAFATNSGTVSESTSTNCHNSRVIQSIYTEDQTWRDTHQDLISTAASESGYLIEAYDQTTGDNGIVMHFPIGDTLYWRPAYQAKTAQDNVIITIPLSNSNWSVSAKSIISGVQGYKDGTTTSWYDQFRSTSGSTPATGATYTATTKALVVKISHMDAGDFWMSSYAATITNPSVTVHTGIFDSGRITISSTMTDQKNCDARTVIPLPTYVGTEICGPDNDTVVVDPTWLAAWGEYVDGPWTDLKYTSDHQIRGSANIKAQYRNSYVWASWNGKAGDWTSWRLYPGTEGGLIWTDKSTVCVTPTWINCRSFQLVWSNVPVGGNVRIIWKDANDKWLGFTDQKRTAHTWAKYDMPINTATVTYIITDSTGAVVSQNTVANTTPCASSGTWNGCDSFSVKTANYPGNYKVKIEWQQNGQGQSTTKSASTTNTTGWWSGTGRESVTDFHYTILDANGKTVYTSETIKKDAICTALGSISGTVYWDNDVNKTVSDGDARYTGKTVSLVDQATGKVISEAKTDANGDYIFGGVTTGTYSVYIVPVTGTEEASAPVKISDIAVGRAQDITGINFGLHKKVISGGKGDTVIPSTTSKAAPSTNTPPLVGELPHTGPNDTYGIQGLFISLVAAIATYGAVFFAQGKRQYK